MTDQEKISNGICVSPYTTEKCPYCVDTCDARHFAWEITKAKRIALNQCEICGAPNGQPHNLVDSEKCPRS